VVTMVTAVDDDTDEDDTTSVTAVDIEGVKLTLLLDGVETGSKMVGELTISLVNEDGLPLETIAKVGVKDETGMLEPGLVEFTPGCDNTLGDRVTKIEDTGMTIDEKTNVEELSWLIEDNITVRAIMGEVVLSGAILAIGIPGELVKPVESVSELDNTSTAVADDGLVLLGSMGPEDGVSLIIILGTVLRGTETVGDGSTEEVADTEVKIVIVVKLLLILCEETDEDMVTSGAFLEVEMVTGEVNEASLRGNGIDDNCPVVEDAGGKTVVSDWSDVMKPDEDRLL